jgi:hypothetical protein
VNQGISSSVSGIRGTNEKASGGTNLGRGVKRRRTSEVEEVVRGGGGGAVANRATYDQLLTTVTALFIDNVELRANSNTLTAELDAAIVNNRQVARAFLRLLPYTAVDGVVTIYQGSVRFGNGHSCRAGSERIHWIYHSRSASSCHRHQL